VKIFKKAASGLKMYLAARIFSPFLEMGYK
jgi:hypothetical protein